MTPQETELLIRIDERVRGFDGKLELLTKGINIRMDAQEARISSLPQWHHVAAALITGIVALGGGIVKTILARR